MKNHEQEDVLFHAWRIDREPVKQQKECPSGEEIFDAVMLKLPLQRRRVLVLHISRCGGCAESWRLAAELYAPAEVVNISHRYSRLPLRNPSAWGLAAAASLVLMIGIVWILPTQDPGFPDIGGNTTLRGDIEQSIQLEIPESVRLLANDFELRWSAVQGTDEYRVHITNAQLETVFAATTQMTNLKVPLSVLSAVEAEEPLYWHVSAIKPDGSVTRSSTRTIFVQHSVNSE